VTATNRFCSNCGAPLEAAASPRVAVPADLAERARDFAGRSWVLDEVANWLERGTERFMLITGEPSAGKSALAAWLAGAGTAPESLASRLDTVRDTWRAGHFCVAGDKGGSLHPVKFAQSLARQLSERYDDYAQEVLYQIAPEIYIAQEVGKNRGRVIGAQIETLIASAIPPGASPSSSTRSTKH
jgi:hypothetical protein